MGSKEELSTASFTLANTNLRSLMFPCCKWQGATSRSRRKWHPPLGGDAESVIDIGKGLAILSNSSALISCLSKLRTHDLPKHLNKLFLQFLSVARRLRSLFTLLITQRFRNLIRPRTGLSSSGPLAFRCARPEEWSCHPHTGRRMETWS